MTIDEVYEDENVVDLRIVSNGKQKSLNQLLPSDWRFKRVPYHYKDIILGANAVSYLDKEVWYQHTMLSFWRGQLSVLHEISHAEEYPDLSLLGEDHRDFNSKSEQFDGLNVFEEKIINTNVPENTLKNLSRVEISDLVYKIISKSSEYKSRALDCISECYESERIAWDGALQKMQALKEEGFDIAKGISESEIESYVNICLDNHTGRLQIKLGFYGLGESEQACCLRDIKRPTVQELLYQYDFVRDRLIESGQLRGSWVDFY